MIGVFVTFIRVVYGTMIYMSVPKRLIYIEKIAAENKYLGRENKQIMPSLKDFMTGRFYIVILFMKQFRGSADFAFNFVNISSEV